MLFRRAALDAALIARLFIAAFLIRVHGESFRNENGFLSLSRLRGSGVWVKS
jgi:hypothetical protein